MIAWTYKPTDWLIDGFADHHDVKKNKFILIWSFIHHHRCKTSCIWIIPENWKSLRCISTVTNLQLSCGFQPLLCLCWAGKIISAPQKTKKAQSDFSFSLSTTLGGRSVLIFSEEKVLSLFCKLQSIESVSLRSSASPRAMVGGRGLKSIRREPSGINQCERAGERGCVRKGKKERDAEIRRRSVREQMRERERRNWLSDIVFSLETWSNIVQCWGRPQPQI